MIATWGFEGHNNFAIRLPYDPGTLKDSTRLNYLCTAKDLEYALPNSQGKYRLKPHVSQ
jgi:hypothetical protein